MVLLQTMMEMTTYLMTKMSILRCKRTRCLEHPRMTIIILLLMMMSTMIVQFGNPVTQPFLSRSVIVPTTEVGCLSLTSIFQDYLQEYPLLPQADAFLQIQEMAQRLDMYLKRYPQHINCMTSDSEFVAC